MKKNLLLYVYITFFLVSLTSIYYLSKNIYLIPEGYKNLYLLPLFYIISLTLIILLVKNNTNIFIVVYYLVAFVRYVVLSFLIVNTDLYSGFSNISPKADSVSLGINLMIYEIIITTLFIIILDKFSKKKPKKREIVLPKFNIFYYLFLSFSLLLIIIFPDTINFFSFISKNTNAISSMPDATYNFITMVLVTAKNLFYILLIIYLYKKFNESKSKKYIFISIILTLLHISTFYGENRADLLITGLSSMIIFLYLYKNYSKYLVIPILIAISILFLDLTEQRGYSSFNTTENELQSMANTIQVYVGGPYNVAMSVETKENYSEIANTNIIFEFFRSFIGVNILLKNFDFITSSELFNYRIFFEDNVSQIIPIIGQGYYFLGFWLSPLFSMLFIYVAIKLNDLMSRRVTLEIQYFIIIIIIRMGFLMGHNSIILMNEISYNLVIIFCLYFLNSIFRRNREGGKTNE